MAVNQEIRRASDNVLLCDEIVGWSGWLPHYNAPVLETVNFIPYVQPIGVAIELQTVKALFADHYPGATMTKFRALWQAHRFSKALTFTDLTGDTRRCFIYSPITEDSIERWEEVPTKTILRVDVVLMKEDFVR